VAYKILVAENNKLNCKLIVDTIDLSNEFVCQTFTANDGNQAWAECCVENLDLVIYNWDLPEINGLDFIQRMKKNSRCKDIPIIIFSNQNSSNVLREALNAGAEDFVKSPIDLIELEARVKSALMIKDDIESVKNINKLIETQNQELNRLSFIVKQTDNAVIIFNKEGKIEWANKGFKKMYGYSLEEFLQRKGNNISSISYNSHIQTHIQKLLQTSKSVNYITKCRVKYGAIKWIQTTLSPIFDGDKIDKIIAIESDISQQKRAEMELVKKNEETKELMDSIKKANQLLESQKKEIENINKRLENEKNTVNQILNNTLPQSIIEQLRDVGHYTARNYNKATIMFTDFKGFTKSCENLNGMQIVQALDFFFSKFDEIISNHSIEKIKTIGDSYMCVGGIPIRNRSHVFDIMLAALEILKFMKEYRNHSGELFLPDWKLRIGIHTGSITTGIVGKIKYAYDTWGDSVNIAKRMESADEIGYINVSSSTYEYIKDYFVCSHRGPTEIKNHTHIDTYLVERLKPIYSEDEFGFLPNQEFKKIVNRL